MLGHPEDEKFWGRIFNNLESYQTVDENTQVKERPSGFSLIIERIFDRVEQIALNHWGEYFNEEDVARLLRIPDPTGEGKRTVRNYALRSRKIPFAKIGRQSLLFHKKDIKILYEALRSEVFSEL